MRVNVVFFARLRREMRMDSLSLELVEAADVRAVATAIEQQHGVSLKGCMVAVNETYATPEQVLHDGDEVAFLPPVAGGSDSGEDSETLCEVTASPLFLQTADAFLVQPAYGAQAYFVGTVRSPNKGKQVEFIEYEGFAPLAQKVMLGAAEAARERHGTLRVFIQHRVGRLVPGEASILIGVASPHRRAALEACDFIIEFLKVQVPVWKREVDEDGEHWVDGTVGQPTL
ncbi:molybdopterin converting factor subunit 1 [Deinococcus puniceus]|uniref:Molybdenum cofactor biosynthesis protein MoaD n=1 Tax=Deinococcus puniceus TaxID=1182568 RepID=A0A172TC02_9DEIO|nr:molybdopterin converting factor subunit 1 [Deinococcus puniceus]ANE44585.1 molybdenum cofactor biosynthesis protein MoaD [Deinococcus puniceus]